MLKIEKYPRIQCFIFYHTCNVGHRALIYFSNTLVLAHYQHMKQDLLLVEPFSEFFIFTGIHCHSLVKISRVFHLVKLDL